MTITTMLEIQIVDSRLSSELILIFGWELVVLHTTPFTLGKFPCMHRGSE